MSDEKKLEGQEAPAPGDQAKPTTRKRASAAPTKSAMDQLKADLAERASALPEPAPTAPAPQGSGIHDAFGVELPTEEQYVKAGGKPADYDSYVVSRCTLSKPEAPKAAEQATMSGTAAAELFLAEQIRLRTGQSIEPPVRPQDMKEDWQEVQAGVKPPANPLFAGLYVVTHGTIFFHSGKIVPKGRKVMLGAEDAKCFMELNMVRPLRSAA